MLPKRKLIENYIVQIDRPFCIREISQITGVPYSTVSENVSKFNEQGRIIVIHDSNTPRFYRYVRNSKATKKTNPLNFTPQIEKLRIIYDKIGLLHRVADVVNTLSFSESTVWRYIKILLHDECIRKHRGRYYQKVFKPSGRSFDEYPRIIKHSKRPAIIRDLEQICYKGNFEVPNVDDLTNVEIINLSERRQIQTTILLINRRENYNGNQTRKSS
ncbi:MAG: hypothetical protein KAS53_05210 [Candidatus Cloacimonetes bacterium]|nr:hypothetical protein [Candidatus Cloacimonadota bacterium]